MFGSINTFWFLVKKWPELYLTEHFPNQSGILIKASVICLMASLFSVTAICPTISYKINVIFNPTIEGIIEINKDHLQSNNTKRLVDTITSKVAMVIGRIMSYVN